MGSRGVRAKTLIFNENELETALELLNYYTITRLLILKSAIKTAIPNLLF